MASTQKSQHQQQSTEVDDTAAKAIESVQLKKDDESQYQEQSTEEDDTATIAIESVQLKKDDESQPQPQPTEVDDTAAKAIELVQLKKDDESQPQQQPEEVDDTAAKSIESVQLEMNEKSQHVDLHQEQPSEANATMVQASESVQLEMDQQQPSEAEDTVVQASESIHIEIKCDSVQSRLQAKIELAAHLPCLASAYVRIYSQLYSVLAIMINALMTAHPKINQVLAVLVMFIIGAKYLKETVSLVFFEELDGTETLIAVICCAFVLHLTVFIFCVLRDYFIVSSDCPLYCVLAIVCIILQVALNLLDMFKWLYDISGLLILIVACLLCLFYCARLLFIRFYDPVTVNADFDQLCVILSKLEMTTFGAILIAGVMFMTWDWLVDHPNWFFVAFQSGTALFGCLVLIDRKLDQLQSINRENCN